ncbi:hypothetical protein WICPIJ_005365 [Wickerhamomyces pijperi]|uniref:Autophagy-related protein 9 n=1 Tax=Wickerhamomyces pijperi TaxID=599730 RepID=A0A9P8Q427_WICPI|nr:hypothetical protein WICPIJ_005365 [Wickerhamomyces pijperi]
MANTNPNNFLSRVFGSANPNHEEELASFRGNHYDEESQDFMPSDGLLPQKRSVIESDNEDSDSEADEGQNDYYDHDPSGRILNKSGRHMNGITEADEEGEKEDEVPMSIMVHQDDLPRKMKAGAVSQPLPNVNFTKNPKIKHQRIDMINSPPVITNDKLFSHGNTPISQRRESNRQHSTSINDDERSRRARLGILNPKERALWKWANVENLDKFLQDVYSYYLGSGYYCIMLSKFFDLATLVFVVYFSTYLTTCIDYSKLKLPTTRGLQDITVDQCFSNISFSGKFCLSFLFIYFILKLVQLYVDAKDLVEIHNFYKYLLEITDKDLETISWQVVVHRIMLLKDQNAITSNAADMKSKSRIDAHDIANRIMRKENYFIALFNKDILDLTLPIPGYGENVLTRTLEWNLQLCISGFVFNDSGQVRQQFLKEANRKEMSEELKKRFMLAGLLNIILSPLLVVYFLLLYFFRYFNEYRKNPGSIGSRQYTPLAEWKFREFNELYHIFHRRLNLSVPEASKYIDQFPKEKMVIILKFVSFVSGSFAAVLGILSIVDPDMFFNFEITKDRTVLFYISIFGTIWAVSHGAIPEDYQVFDSETSLKTVAEYTHFLPEQWEGKYHTEEVRNEFCNYFSLKPVLLIREIASLILTPFILWFSLPKSSEKIIDFFREYSVHVDGLGYVCTFAMFNFEKIRNSSNPTKSIANDLKRRQKDKTTHYSSGDEKMMKSYLYFLDSYGDYETQRNGATSPVNRFSQQPGSKPHNLSKSKPSMTQSVHARFNGTTGNNWNPLSRKTPHNMEDYSSRSINLDPLERTQSLNHHGIGGSILRDRFSPNNEQLLGESFITSMPKTDSVDTEQNEDPGVLGLLNQFYKDYHISH